MHTFYGRRQGESVCLGSGLLRLLALLLALLPGCRGTEEASAGSQGVGAVPPAVEALRARSGSLPLEERLSGVVRARNQVAIRAEIEALVAEVLVQTGEAVERGQPLVRLEAVDLRERLRQTEASVRLASATAREARARVRELEARVSRSRALAEQALVSDLELETREAQLAAAQASADQAEARVDEARATVEERRSTLGKTLVKAPVSGRIGRRNAEPPGMLVGSNTLLFMVGNLDELIVEVPLAEEMLRHIREGQPVRIGARVLADQLMSATLSRISPFLEAQSFSTLAEIDVANTGGRLRPGMFVTVDVLYGESEQATLVPACALWEDPRSGAVVVFVVGDMEGGAAASLSEEAHAVERRPVELVADGKDTLGVAGVEPGEWVVTVGQHLLATEEEPRARVRATDWERVLHLQGLQQEDLLRGYLDKQRRLARARGARPPSNREFLGEAQDDDARRSSGSGK